MSEHKEYRYDEFNPDNAAVTVANLTAFANCYGVSLEDVEVEAGEGYLHVSTYSPENAEEKKDRLRREEEQKVRGLAARREQYERLKKEFENE